MLELLNQLDGFASDDRVKVLAATNRVDVLDPALLRSGRLDRKIEFPLPNEEARAQILRIHSRKMTVDEGVNWQELARSTDEFGGAQLKAVCVEAGMIALRSGQHKISHEHYVDAIAEVQVRLDLPTTATLNPTDTLVGQEEGHCQLLRIERRRLDKAGWSHGALLGRACSLVRASHDRTIMIRTQRLHCCVSFVSRIKKLEAPKTLTFILRPLLSLQFHSLLFVEPHCRLLCPPSVYERVIPGCGAGLSGLPIPNPLRLIVRTRPQPLPTTLSPPSSV
jgi:hypothetical protein